MAPARKASNPVRKMKKEMRFIASDFQAKAAACRRMWAAFSVTRAR
jgi:hypothetical protein